MHGRRPGHGARRPACGNTPSPALQGGQGCRRLDVHLGITAGELRAHVAGKGRVAPPRPPCLRGAGTRRLGHGDPGDFPLSSPSVASAPTYTYLPVHLSIISLSIHLSVIYPWISLVCHPCIIYRSPIVDQSTCQLSVMSICLSSVIYLSSNCPVTHGRMKPARLRGSPGGWPPWGAPCTPRAWGRQARTVLSPRRRRGHQGGGLGQLTAVTASQWLPSQTRPPRWGHTASRALTAPGVLGWGLLGRGSVGRRRHLLSPGTWLSHTWLGVFSEALGR